MLNHLDDVPACRIVILRLLKLDADFNMMLANMNYLLQLLTSLILVDQACWEYGRENCGGL